MKAIFGTGLAFTLLAAAVAMTGCKSESGEESSSLKCSITPAETF